MQKLNVLFAPAVHGTTPYSAFGHPTWKAFFHACLMVVQHNCYDSSRFAMPHPIHACSTSQQVLNFAYYQPIVAIHQMPSGVLPYYNKMVLVFVQFCIVVQSNQFTQLLANLNHCTWCTTVEPYSTTGVQRFQWNRNQHTVFFLHIVFLHKLKSELEMQNIIRKGFSLFPPWMHYCIPYSVTLTRECESQCTSPKYTGCGGSPCNAKSEGCIGDAEQIICQGLLRVYQKCF